MIREFIAEMITEAMVMNGLRRVLGHYFPELTSQLSPPLGSLCLQLGGCLLDGFSVLFRGVISVWGCACNSRLYFPCSSSCSGNKATAISPMIGMMLLTGFVVLGSLSADRFGMKKVRVYSTLIIPGVQRHAIKGAPLLLKLVRRCSFKISSPLLLSSKI